MALGCIATASAWMISAREAVPQFTNAFRSSDQKDPTPRADLLRWPIATYSKCNDGGTSPLGGQVCILSTDRRNYRKNEAIVARIKWSHVPTGSSFMVYLERDDQRGDQRYLGTVGALSLDPFPISGNGETQFAWNGRQFPCAPSDFPMLCNSSAEIGRYRLRVALYDSVQLRVVGWPDPNPPNLLAHSVSLPFRVEGMPNLQPIARSLWWASVNEAMQARQIDSSLALVGDTNGSGLVVFQRGSNALCARVPSTPPYKSSMEACVPKAAVTGEAGLLYIEPEAAQVVSPCSMARCRERQQ
jgi:hypothetical protein